MSMSAQQQSRLTGEGLIVGYHKDDPAVLNDLDVHIPHGEITALIGANGSGKTTLLRTLGRHLKPQSGQVYLDGRDIATQPLRDIARKIGNLFQENARQGGLTVEELAYHGRFPYRRLFDSLSAEDHAAVEKALELTGMAALRHRPLEELSGGQKQLAWITLALAQSTRILLLDEPTTFLDLKHQLEIMQIIRKLKEDMGITIVMILHDINQAARYSDHMIAMREGRIIAQGAPASILTPGLVQQTFGIVAEILQTSDGTPICVPKNAIEDESR